MKTSKVSSVEFRKEFDTKHGTMFSWNVEMENGDQGETVTKTDKRPWGVGDSAEYEVEFREHNGKQYPKLKKANAQAMNGAGGAARGWSPEKEASVMTQGFIHAAVTAGAKDPEAIVASVVAQTKAYATIMDKWRSQHAPKPEPEQRKGIDVDKVNRAEELLNDLPW